MTFHSHRQTVTFQDGTTVDAASYIGNDDQSAHDRFPTPDFGVYLDHIWAPPWSYVHVEWPDFGVPSDSIALRVRCEEILRRARSGERVEIGCVGGHGRTGTLLALLAIMTGTPVSEAVAWVRDGYCSSAIETAEQECFVASWSGNLPR